MKTLKQLELEDLWTPENKLEYLRLYNAWRRGEDTGDEEGFCPAPHMVGNIISWAVEFIGNILYQ